MTEHDKHADVSKETKDITSQELLVELPPYKFIEYERLEFTGNWLLRNPGNTVVDCYCRECGRESTFRDVYHSKKEELLTEGYWDLVDWWF